MPGKFKRGVIFGILASFLVISNVSAADTIDISGSFTSDEEISIYVKGIASDLDNVSCQIGTKSDQKIKYEKVSEMENSAKTLIMIDNSLSITKENRNKIEEFVKEYAYEKPKEEEVMFATFSEKVDDYSEYISDRRQIEELVGALEYNDQETYLTDVLYDVINEKYMGADDDFKKIIIISDGVDNKSIGYTKEELYSLIKDIQYPIYTIGCKYKSNNEQLENMFALSRMTHSVSYILDETDDINSMAKEIVDDSVAYHFTVSPVSELMDGSKKNVQIKIETSEGTKTIEAMVRMPLKAEVETVVPEPVVEEPKSEPAPVETEPVVVPEKDNSKIIIIVAISIGALVLIGAIVAVIVIVLKKKKERNNFVNLTEAVEPTPEPTVEEHTSIERNWDDDEATQMIWNDYEVRNFNIVLTDMRNQGKCFQKPIDGEIIIGRKAVESNLVIDYEKSISGKHCSIFARNGKVFVKDLNSSNGTFVNDVRVFSDIELNSGCILKLGRLEMRVEIR